MHEQTVLLPVGSVEQHGFLPLDTDTLIARSFCELVKSKLDVIVVESINKGFCPTTALLSGTVFMCFKDVLACALDRIEDLIDQGHCYIIIVNIHAANDSVLTAAVQDTYSQRGIPLFYFNPYRAFAHDLDPVCFANRDNNLKECSLLLASLEILGMQPISTPSVDEDAKRNPLIEKLRQGGLVGFSYELPSQHVAWRAQADAKAGHMYMEETAARFIPLANDFRRYVRQELEKKK